MATYTRSSSGVVTPDSDDEEESLLGGGRREKVVRLSRRTTGAIGLLIGAHGRMVLRHAHYARGRNCAAAAAAIETEARATAATTVARVAAAVAPAGAADAPSAAAQRRPPLPPGAAPLPGFVFAGVGHLPGNEPGGAPQPGNVTVAECAATCRRWGWSCLGFSYFARPSWSPVSECYIKKVCTLGRVHTLAGALTFQVDDTGRCPAPDWEQHLAKVAGGFSYAEFAEEGVR